ncbi:hypothetical protein MMC12_000693 [Toensbergia leucococca]|nr:hypothetical protein [Toensbergia leucococca]
MRNLIDFACNVVSRRPGCFNFSFQMVSSIGVVGHYGLGNGEEKTMVHEERVGVDSLLPNGYGDAKWVCERMLDKTLHKNPDRFRTMAVRLGQIAGFKTIGTESNGASQIYVQVVADIERLAGPGALSDLVLSDSTPYPIYHVENSVGQPCREMNATLADWIEHVRAGPQRNNPAATLLDFLDSNYLRMSCGGSFWT